MSYKKVNIYRKGWHEALDAYIWARDKGICVYCGEQGQEIDHVVPCKFGGPTNKSNGVLCCRKCNRVKGAGLNQDMITKAFYHLISQGENLDWLDDLWNSSRGKLK